MKYDRLLFSCVLIPGTFDGRPLDIIHAPGDRVWVAVSYADTIPDSALPVGDGLGDGFDQDGQRLISLPQSVCKFLTHPEAEQIMEAQAADARLLAYAHG